MKFPQLNWQTLLLGLIGAPVLWFFLLWLHPRIPILTALYVLPTLIAAACAYFLVISLDYALAVRSKYFDDFPLRCAMGLGVCLLLNAMTLSADEKWQLELDAIRQWVALPAHTLGSLFGGLISFFDDLAELIVGAGFTPLANLSDEISSGLSLDVVLPIWGSVQFNDTWAKIAAHIFIGTVSGVLTVFLVSLIRRLLFGAQRNTAND